MSGEQEINDTLNIGLDNNDLIVVSAGDSLTSDDLERSFAIYAPFGDVDLTSVQFNNHVLSNLTLLGGAQIFGRVLAIELDSGSNPLLVYVKKY
jgi:hypothetical protein